MSSFLRIYLLLTVAPLAVHELWLGAAGLGAARWAGRSRRARHDGCWGSRLLGLLDGRRNGCWGCSMGYGRDTTAAGAAG